MKPAWNPDTTLAALRFAAQAHAGQTITGAEIPYIVHPCQVAMEVMTAIATEGAEDPDLGVLCALLHDVIEDTSVTVEAVEAAFGRAVASGVSALSKDEALPKGQAMPDSLARIIAQPLAVWMVKLADRISNLAPPPPHWDASRCAAYQTEARVILDALGAASPFLAARLAARIESYTQYTREEGTSRVPAEFSARLPSPVRNA